jgi:hypothetical protein
MNAATLLPLEQQQVPFDFAQALTEPSARFGMTKIWFKPVRNGKLIM